MLVHRTALGALAGMNFPRLLFAPDRPFGDEVTKIGFSLFTLAFLFGFSLDIFFTMIDRFVVLASAAAGRYLARPNPAATASLLKNRHDCGSRRLT